MIKIQPDKRLVEHEAIWKKKASLRAVYQDYHKRLLSACPPGRILDIGGGSGHAKKFEKNVVSIDILPFPGLDVACDAHNLPFTDEIFSGIVMLDVLHHLSNPVLFLNEAARVLISGGRLVMIEPGMSIVSTPFYQYLHQEPVDFKVDPFVTVAKDVDRDPFDSNQALPTLLFSSKKSINRLNILVPSLSIQKIDWISLFAYPLCGGFKPWSLVPGSLVPHIITIEEKIPKCIRERMAFRLYIEIIKI